MICSHPIRRENDDSITSGIWIPDRISGSTHTRPAESSSHLTITTLTSPCWPVENQHQAHYDPSTSAAERDPTCCEVSDPGVAAGGISPAERGRGDYVPATNPAQVRLRLDGRGGGGEEKGLLGGGGERVSR